MVYRPTGEQEVSDMPEGAENFLESSEKDDIYADADLIKDGHVPRLNLANYRATLLAETLDLNTDFLGESEEQFAQYLSLTTIQQLFDENMNDPDFVQIFANKEHSDMALGAELVEAQLIVDNLVGEFATLHKEK